MARLAPWLQKAPPQGTAAQKAEPAPWQHAGQEHKLLDHIRAALEASPSKIVLIVSRDHEGNAPGSWHADQLKLPSGERGWAHVSVAWVNADGRPVFAEKTPGDGAGPLVSKNKSGIVQDMAKYREVEIIPLDLSRFGPGARARFINAFLEALSRPYSGFARFGDHCSSAFEKALAAAIDPSKAAVARELIRTTMLPNVYTPNDAYLHGKQLSVPFRYDPNSPTQGQTVKKDWLHPPQEGRGAVKKQAVNSADDNAESLVALAGAITLSSETALTRKQPADDDKEPSQEEIEFALSDKVNEDARTDNAPQDAGTGEDDDGETLEARTSDEKDASTHDAGQQPAIDDDVDHDDEPLHDEVILASDPEDARTDDDLRQPATDDDDEELSQAIDEEEEQADASDAQDGSTADALMQAATVSTDATTDDEAGSQLATSAPGAADEGFSFSQFPTTGIPTEVAKEALPAEQTSPGEDNSSPGVPGSESAHPDLGSADVGNAAPSNERVVHHGELAP